MAGHSIGKAWQRGKGKPRDVLCRKFACSQCVCVCILVISTRRQRTVPLPIKGLMTNWPHHGIQRIRILGLASFMVDLVEGHLLRLLLPGIPTKYSWSGRCDRKVSHSLSFLASNFNCRTPSSCPHGCPKLSPTHLLRQSAVLIFFQFSKSREDSPCNYGGNAML
jgi:hypothetical protein